MEGAGLLLLADLEALPFLPAFLQASWVLLKKR